MALTPAQLAERRTFLGGTDMAALVGVSRWATPLDVYLEKVETGPVVERRKTSLMDMGTMLEPVIASAFTRATGIRLTRVNRTIRHPQAPWLGGHLDRWAPGLVVETKYVHMRKDDWGAQGTTLVPPAYHIQLQHYLAITGRAHGYLAVLFGDGDFRWYALPADRETADLMWELGYTFWHQHVLPQVPPPPDGSTSYGEWLNRRWADAAGPSMVATPEQQLLADDLRIATRDVLTAQHHQAILEQRLKDSMRDTTALELPSGRITWRPYERRSTDWQAVLADLHPEGVPLDRIALHTTSSRPRPLRVPWPTTLEALAREGQDEEGDN